MSKDVDAVSVDATGQPFAKYENERMYTIDEVHSQTWLGIGVGLIVGVLLGIGGYGLFVIG